MMTSEPWKCSDVVPDTQLLALQIIQRSTGTEVPCKDVALLLGLAMLFTGLPLWTILSSEPAVRGWIVVAVALLPVFDAPV